MNTRSINNLATISLVLAFTILVLAFQNCGGLKANDSLVILPSILESNQAELFEEDVEFTSIFSEDFLYQTDNRVGFWGNVDGLSLESTEKLFGQNSLKVAFLNKSFGVLFPDREEVWLRVFVYFPEEIKNIESNIKIVDFSSGIDEEAQSIASWYLEKSGEGSFKLKFSYFNGSAQVSQSDVLGENFLSSGDYNVWTELIVRIKIDSPSSSSGTLQMWKNSHLVTNQFGLKIPSQDAIVSLQFFNLDQEFPDNYVLLDGLQVLKNP